ncbi:MCP four helix bundle domain-containing protein [Spirosoma endbachense]|uniref:Chemotaxis methyl-accepting receptor HlyB-like 4HB MCP domain-containing protein n=1 Tax=Spirosoma endbachense TaxID=2666025 RepID=A0A6P1VUB8_9BACT|nr:MCP four helix bundle domain-containing protein [Spirosoma endbachense]QHV96673.1 hypothetical protein GJR95_17380 [Spirosoma endbachense]
MKWSFIGQQKLKAAGLLLSLMLVILFTATSLKHAVQDMDQTMASLYRDRLQPAVDLVHISESLHAKRLVLDNQFLTQSPLSGSVLVRYLRQHDQQIANRIGHYEKTKLTADEAIWLKSFKQNWAQGKQVEGLIQQLMATGKWAVARQLFSERGATLFKQSIQSVHELAQIQTKTGQSAVKEAHQLAAGGSLNVSLLTAISLLVGLVILGLIQNTSLRSLESPLFPLN